MVKFAFNLTALLMGVFSIHLFLLFIEQKPLFGSQLIKAYFINTAATLIIYWAIQRFKDKHPSKLGFIFLFGSGLKFFFFFFFFFAGYKADNEITAMEFLTFFTPYTACLIFETYVLSKELNQI